MEQGKLRLVPRRVDVLRAVVFLPEAGGVDVPAAGEEQSVVARGVGGTVAPVGPGAGGKCTVR